MMGGSFSNRNEKHGEIHSKTEKHSGTNGFLNITFSKQNRLVISIKPIVNRFLKHSAITHRYFYNVMIESKKKWHFFVNFYDIKL